MTELTPDAGALIAIDRNPEDALVTRGRQARLAGFLEAKDGPAIAPLDGRTARAAGELCGRTGTADVVDASVAACALLRKDHVVTSDPADIARLDPAISLIAL
ncbi:MAG: hypothetical protein ACRDYA_00800 [Egibacteraceae bacterium]